MKKKSNFVFGVNPTVSKQRSKFNLNYSHKTTMDTGDLCPVYLQEVYPGDTFSGDTTFVIRSTNPYIRVPMDNLFMDIAYFFVPHRLVYDKWKNVMGENTDSAWVPSQEYQVPQVTIPTNLASTPKNISSYFGIPNGTTVTGISALPFRGFALIYNEFWRDQNLIPPTYIRMGTTESSLNANAFSQNNYLGIVPKACKIHDYFTTCLPGTQKGTAPTLSLSGNAPVVTTEQDVVNASANPLHFRKVGTANQSIADLEGSAIGIIGTDGSTTNRPIGITGALANTSDVGTDALFPSNLSLDLTNASLNAGSINELRLLFQIQKLYELSARGGTRYRESIYNLFGVKSPESAQQVPEYLGGRRTPISISQVNQTTPSSNAGQVVGTVGGFTQSIGQAKFGKSLLNTVILLVLLVFDKCTHINKVLNVTFSVEVV